ncbi:DUF1684 domain-containing protein [Arthrobacter sp. H5]|uniref:DUF1684 domain-containing protein n=1 Tax=Arthrobacter sp. H5 TaxID=1267973 RepID=UPI000480F52C|nr:DUF1684 domain-containing protein [Arthrobacter sp. H5]
MSNPATALNIADWRRRVFELYRQVREITESGSPSLAHAHWRTERDRLFKGHPASPLDANAKAQFSGLTVAGYQPDFRFEVDINDGGAGQTMDVPTGTDGVVPFERLGTVELDGVGRLALWRLMSYGGGLFLPVRDSLAGAPEGTYGGGRYLLDTVKGSDLGTRDSRLIIDFNFAYNPSCAYDEQWACPLPGPDNRLEAALPVGEMYAQY